MDKRQREARKRIVTNDKTFRSACEMAGVRPTFAQYIKYKGGEGLSYRFKAAAEVKHMLRTWRMTKQERDEVHKELNELLREARS